MHKLLIINKAQFGYHTDYYKYCQYLRDDFDITYFCFDAGLKRLEMPGVNVQYISSKGFRLLRGTRFILWALFTVFGFKGIVFIHYFKNCQLLKHLLPWKKMILDIRSLSINKNEKIRIEYDNRLKKEIRYFDFVTIISEGLRKKIDLDLNKSAILPLGADIISRKDKKFNENVKLLYAGTLNGRNIHQTIIGLYFFLKENPSYKNIVYDIIGDGKELSDLKKLVSEYKLENIVKIHGRIPHFEINPFFDKCNIGISYVPMTDYYEHQPVTKTYEYILSGMPCIATKTYENRQLITSENGVLCDDDPKSFALGLEQIIANLDTYKSEKIRSTLIDNTWENISKTTFTPILSRFV